MIHHDSSFRCCPRLLHDVVNCALTAAVEIIVTNPGLLRASGLAL